VRPAFVDERDDAFGVLVAIVMCLEDVDVHGGVAAVSDDFDRDRVPSLGINGRLEFGEFL
jgi:hypothetical protein